MPLTVSGLAKKIVALDSREQEALLEKVAELNFQRGLAALSRKYQERLAQERKLSQNAMEILTELRQMREDIAAHDYSR